MATTLLDRNALTITTQIFPQQVVPNTSGPAEMMPSQPESNFESFFRGQPKALGRAQLISGSLALLLGFVLMLLPEEPTYPSELRENYMKSLFVIWMPMINIMVGCLSFIEEKNLSIGMVKLFLAMNVVSAVTAGIYSALLLCLLTQPPYRYDYYESFWNSRKTAVIGILLVLSVLQVIISIFISVSACTATCSTGAMVGINEKHVQASQLNTVSIANPALNISEGVYETPDVEEQPAGQSVGPTEQKKALMVNVNERRTTEE